MIVHGTGLFLDFVVSFTLQMERALEVNCLRS